MDTVIFIYKIKTYCSDCGLGKGNHIFHACYFMLPNHIAMVTMHLRADVIFAYHFGFRMVINLLKPSCNFFGSYVP